MQDKRLSVALKKPIGERLAQLLDFTAKADVEGRNDTVALFRSTVEGEAGHAHGHL